MTERDGGGPGAAPSYQDYLAQDSRAVPRSLLERSWRDLGNTPLDASRDTSQAFFDLEVERMWTRVWQMARREEELPEAGDTVAYDIIGRSLLITRQADGSIRAFHRSCTAPRPRAAARGRARRALPLPVSWHQLAARWQRTVSAVPVGL